MSYTSRMLYIDYYKKYPEEAKVTAEELKKIQKEANKFAEEQKQNLIDGKLSAFRWRFF